MLPSGTSEWIYVHSGLQLSVHALRKHLYSTEYTSLMRGSYHLSLRPVSRSLPSHAAETMQLGILPWYK